MLCRIRSLRLPMRAPRGRGAWSRTDLFWTAWSNDNQTWIRLEATASVAVIHRSGISPRSTTNVFIRPIPSHTSLPPCSRRVTRSG
jgi:hypothetical protein